jgi:hypothetical protein
MSENPGSLQLFIRAWPRPCLFGIFCKLAHRLWCDQQVLLIKKPPVVNIAERIFQPVA